jgi:hypothetical protein
MGKSKKEHGMIREDEAEYFEKGERLYRKLRSQLEKDHSGEVVAIDPNSGEYVIGRDELEAAQKAREKFPGKLLDYFRIGEDVLHKFRRF